MLSSRPDEIPQYLCLEHLCTQCVGVRWGEESKNLAGLQAGVSLPRKCELSSVIFGSLLV